MDTPPTIGVLSPFVSGFYFGGVIRGVANAVAEAGARLVAIQTSDPGVIYSERPDTAPHPQRCGLGAPGRLHRRHRRRHACLPRRDTPVWQAGRADQQAVGRRGVPDRATRQPARRQGRGQAPHRARSPQDRLRRHDAPGRHSGTPRRLRRSPASRPASKLTRRWSSQLRTTRRTSAFGPARTCWPTGCGQPP